MSTEERRPLGRAGILVLLGALGALIVGPVSAGDTITARQVKKIAGKLDDKVAGRVAFATNTQPLRPLDPGGTDAPITQLSTQITAPAPGFLVIEGSMESYNNSDNEPFNCSISVDDVRVPSSVRWVRTDGLDQIGEVDIANEENCDTDAVVPAAAGTHTVELVTAKVDFATTLTDAMTLYALYVPYDGTGGRPTSFGIVRAPARVPHEG